MAGKFGVKNRLIAVQYGGLRSMKYGLILLMFALSSCSTTTDDLERSGSTRQAVFQYSENYQEIYRRIVGPAKNCLEGHLTFSLNASVNIDAQLYSELGFGEISSSLLNVGIRNYNWKAKVERNGDGTKLTVYAGNTVRNQHLIDIVKNWADNNPSCPFS
ncbi:hypothetical protein [Rhizobium laguerreae]|uniref:hypothetical protein n=1 Tax=Rhizobium laguerreae TaxID=1076926 RepID=UPI001C907F5D|nr:hypothetical protein [Rhizobium laguerreae]MBY3386431.1 hypothetical protein [Rhizobium laguerreae]MBY3400514.1 hypothetical protein [Rhizobium laguerreae]MBY3407452.1 hypothetical protein [Rhizobium laguerreae]